MGETTQELGSHSAIRWMDGCVEVMKLRVRKQVRTSPQGFMMLRGLRKKVITKTQRRTPPEEEMLAIPRPMDVDADEDYLQYFQELRRHPEHSPVHRIQAFAQDPSDDV
ncbi:hypothetical protein PIB30_079362 [Stylosanthes scabra]|uniref:Uncharacterized protein n=1 Tax=Stylosanthes scabra TaxID=79078 RepID=A0ABU6ZPQ2_9FABA|nr:hypothetical protein [Stylosanthes scabra]